jgi:proline racemase
MEPTEYPAMSGSNTMCVATVLLETGMVEMREPETTLRLEAPAGVVEVRAACRDGRCESVELTNVPSFAERLDAALEVDGIGTIAVDVAFGGMWYAIADAHELGSRSSRRRRASCPTRASRSGSPPASSCRVCTPRTSTSPV